MLGSVVLPQIFYPTACFYLIHSRFDNFFQFIIQYLAILFQFIFYIFISIYVLCPYYTEISQNEERNKRKLDISKNRMCRKWYPLETKDVNKEFLDDIESDREASNGDSTDDDSEDENVAEMDDEA